MLRERPPQRASTSAVGPGSSRPSTRGSHYALLIAGTGIPAILRFTEPRKFQLVK
jgi:hypothetical protein